MSSIRGIFLTNTYIFIRKILPSPFKGKPNGKPCRTWHECENNFCENGLCTGRFMEWFKEPSMFTKLNLS